MSNGFEHSEDDDWLIIGGGPHGLALAGALLVSGTTDHDHLRIVDAGAQPLWAWRKRADNCRMLMLRSDTRYHLDCWPEAVPYTLDQWGAAHGMADHTRLLDADTDHRVPTTDLFNAHCDWFVQSRGLDRVWRQGTVTSVERTVDGWRVRCATDETLSAARVVLATGQERLYSPDWARDVHPIYHLLTLDRNSPEWQSYRRLTIIGGALSSAGFALGLLRDFGNATPQISLLARSPLKASVLEADLSTLDLDYQRRFGAEDYAERRQLIGAARSGGTMPPLIRRMLLDAPITILHDTVVQAESNDPIRLRLASGAIHETDAVVLGTGFVRGGCANTLIEQVARDYGAPVAADGFPTPDPTLQWLPGLYLMGGAAELELGPVSRNIAGAAQGVARIMNSISRTTTTQIVAPTEV